MSTNKWQTDTEGFIEAVENDEYAELPLETGDVLITDWEGNGIFHPYVEPSSHPDIDREQKHHEEREIEVAEAIEDMFDGVRVEHIEYDEGNQVYYPTMTRPDT